MEDVNDIAFAKKLKIYHDDNATSAIGSIGYFNSQNQLKIVVEPLLFLNQRIPETRGMSSYDKYLSRSPSDAAIISSSLDTNGFIGAANDAFENHLGFILCPQHIYLLIIQQCASHIRKHSLHTKLVHCQGKVKVNVGLSNRPTRSEIASVIEGYSQKVSENCFDESAKSLIFNTHFSCSVADDIVACSVAVMDTTHGYLSNVTQTLCGIPYFILDGNLADWQLLRESVKELVSTRTLPELSSRWLPVLLATLDKIISARQCSESVDINFWQSFYKRGSVLGSGGYTYVNGWINNFFPNLTCKDSFDIETPNNFCRLFEYNNIATITHSNRDTSDNVAFGTDITLFPGSINGVLVSCYDIEMEANKDLVLRSGFTGAELEGDCVRPSVMWFVTSMM